MRKNRQGDIFCVCYLHFHPHPNDTKSCMFNLYKFEVFSRDQMDNLKRQTPLKARSRLNLTFFIAGNFGKQETPFLGEK